MQDMEHMGKELLKGMDPKQLKNIMDSATGKQVSQMVDQGELERAAKAGDTAALRLTVLLGRAILRATILLHRAILRHLPRLLQIHHRLRHGALHLCGSGRIYANRPNPTIGKFCTELFLNREI